jgi:hypothetical protein
MEPTPLHPHPTHTLFIVRRGDGRAQIHPSPLVVHHGDTLRVRNFLEDRQSAHVNFGDDAELESGTNPIPPGGAATFRLQRSDPRFFEYDVRLEPSGQEVIGNSRPGVIVDG